MKAGMTSRITIPDPRSLWGARLLILVWPGMALLFAFFAALSGLFCYPELGFHGPYFAEVSFPGSMRLGIVLQRPPACKVCPSGTPYEGKETGDAREDDDFPRITPPSRKISCLPDGLSRNDWLSYLFLLSVLFLALFGI